MPTDKAGGLTRATARRWPPSRRTILIGGGLLAVAAIAALIIVVRGRSGGASFAGPVPPDAVARLGRGSINVLAVSADGTALAVGGDVGLFVYDARTLADHWAFAAGTRVHSAAFSPDGRYLAAGLQGGTVILFDAASGQQVGSVPVLDDAISLAWGPPAAAGSMLLAAGTNDGHVTVARIFPTGSGPSIEPVGLLNYTPGGVTAVAYSPDGSLLATANRDGKIDVWDAQTAELAGRADRHVRRTRDPGADVAAGQPADDPGGWAG